MKSRGRVLYLCAAALGVSLLAAHVVYLRFLYHNLHAPFWVVSGIAALVVIKHLGFFGPLLAFVRKRRGK